MGYICSYTPTSDGEWATYVAIHRPLMVSGLHTPTSDGEWATYVAIHRPLMLSGLHTPTSDGRRGLHM